MFMRFSFGFIAVGLVLLCAAGAEAQTIGIGPRLSFVKSDVHVEDATRVSGGMVRLRASNRLAAELSVDYRSQVGENLAERIKDYPVQASLLLYGGRSAFAPYLLGGVGWYSQRVETSPAEGVITTTTSRKSGYHAGLGTDVSFGRRFAVHVDYRYTFIGTGDDADTAPAAVPIPGLRSLQDRLGLSHRGSMWTTGVMLYF